MFARQCIVAILFLCYLKPIQCQTVMDSVSSYMLSPCQHLREDQVTLLYSNETVSKQSLYKNNTLQFKINTEKCTVILISGWMMSYNDVFIDELVKEIIKCHRCQIIHVDWDELSHQFYPQAICTIKQLGPTLAKVTTQKLKLIPKNMHCIGFSLGAHCCGFFGNKISAANSTELGRITGLDPAGMLFITGDRLNTKSANFVDVYHTSDFPIGNPSSLGTVDFWINGGKAQKCCPSCAMKKGDDGVEVMKKLVICSHVMAIDYYKRSVCSSDIKATPKNGTHIDNRDQDERKVTFGYNVKDNIIPGNYFAEIN